MLELTNQKILTRVIIWCKNAILPGDYNVYLLIKTTKKTNLYKI